jgi:hypothetical protein
MFLCAIAFNVRTVAAFVPPRCSLSRCALASVCNNEIQSKKRIAVASHLAENTAVELIKNLLCHEPTTVVPTGESQNVGSDDALVEVHCAELTLADLILELIRAVRRRQCAPAHVHADGVEQLQTTFGVARRRANARAA